MIVGRILELAERAVQGIMSRSRNVYYKALGLEIAGYAWLYDPDIRRNFCDAH